MLMLKKLKNQKENQKKKTKKIKILKNKLKQLVMIYNKKWMI